MKAVLPVVTALLAACAGEVPDGRMGAAADAGALMEMDRAFSDAVREGGSEAWVSAFAEEGVVLRDAVGVALGRPDRGVAALDDPGVSLRWEPERAQISEVGDLGWTAGRYVSVYVDARGVAVERRGAYVSIWRLQANGSWKVVMDLRRPTVGDPGTDG